MCVYRLNLNRVCLFVEFEQRKTRKTHSNWDSCCDFNCKWISTVCETHTHTKNTNSYFIVFIIHSAKSTCRLDDIVIGFTLDNSFDFHNTGIGDLFVVVYVLVGIFLVNAGRSIVTVIAIDLGALLTDAVDVSLILFLILIRIWFNVQFLILLLLLFPMRRRRLLHSLY